MATIGIAGGGAWGTALAQTAARANNSVLWWVRDPAHADDIRRSRENKRRLPGVILHPAIELVASPAALDRADAILIAVPAQAVRAVSDTLPHPGATLVICAKGIERSTGQRLSDVVRSLRPRSAVAVLSGPAFAREVAMDRPTAVTIAASSRQRAAGLCELLATPAFRPYPSGDVAGVEIAGAMKNVIAIAAGISMGKELGENARAALVTRGLAEMGRLAAALGGSPATLMGLSGLGDLMLTATSLTSRNTRLGYDLARGGDRATLLGPAHALAEGAWTAAAACAMGKRLGVELPITEAVHRIVEGTRTIDQAIEDLLGRPRPSQE